MMQDPDSIEKHFDDFEKKIDNYIDNIMFPIGGNCNKQDVNFCNKGEHIISSCSRKSGRNFFRNLETIDNYIEDKN